MQAALNLLVILSLIQALLLSILVYIEYKEALANRHLASWIFIKKRAMLLLAKARNLFKRRT